MTMLILASLTAMISTEIISIPAYGADGSDLTISSTYTILGTETWDNVTIQDGGELVIEGGILNAEHLVLESGSILNMTGGDLNLISPTIGGNATLTGNCDYFNITWGSSIRLDGKAGGNSISTSQGGDAVFNITCANIIEIADSTINAFGKNGYNLPASTTSKTNAWSSSNVSGYASAGGNATIYMRSADSIIVRNSYINSTAGSGGDASDGGPGTSSARGYGGGYSNGGVVSEYVGAGGNASITLISYSIEISSSGIKAKGGAGGDAGKGGSGGSASGSSKVHGKGGGGGGYGGGNGGANSNGFPAYVMGQVGVGGSSYIEIRFEEDLDITGSAIVATGGNGGIPDKGGSGGIGYDGPGSIEYYGGGGGGSGYGGGGGGNGNGLAGGNAWVSDQVGAGGPSEIMITGNDDISISTTDISSTGGSGTKAAAGTRGTISSLGGAPGGGGYGGGGGAGGKPWSPRKGGDGNVSGNIGSGGYSIMNLNSNNITVLKSNIRSTGGSGGDAGNGGAGFISGGSGGGYGGGGAGPYGSGSGGKGLINGNVGCGGNSSMNIKADRYLNLMDSEADVQGGDGGDGGIGGGIYRTYENNGGGGGGYTGDGGVGNYYGGGTPGRGKVTGNVGDGGYSHLNLSTAEISRIDNLSFSSDGGIGGYAPNSPGKGYYKARGAGYGRDTVNGSSISELFGIPYAVDLNLSKYIVYRNNYIDVNADGFDQEDPNKDLTCEMGYFMSDGTWSKITPGYNASVSARHWQGSFPVLKNNPTGIYRVGVSFADSDGNTGPYLFADFQVLNNLPEMTYNHFGGSSLYRNSTLRINSSCSDVEDDINDLALDIEYRSPNGNWKDLTNISKTSSQWISYFEPKNGFETGYYDFRTNFIDKDGGATGWIEYEDEVLLINNLPIFLNFSISNGTEFNGTVLRNNTLNVSLKALDIEDQADELDVSIQYRSPVGEWTDLTNITYADGNWTTTFDANISFATGEYEFRFNITDLDGDFLGWFDYWQNIDVLNNIPIFLTESLPDATEDTGYSFNISVADIETKDLICSIESEIGWLHIGSENHTIYGTPSNDDVGIWDVNISVSDGEDTFETNFTLRVFNVNDDPVITNDNVPTCYEDLLYQVNYTAFDIDPTEDEITWTLSTEASFLNIDPDTGVLSGIPTNDDVGTYWVNILISDGNGGINRTDFRLEVINVNDDPEIGSIDIDDSYEDRLFEVELWAWDVDPTNDTIEWSLETNAIFLYIHKFSGRLAGTPGNDDVGSYWVNVSASDNHGGGTHFNFTLAVFNVNDPPQIIYVQDFDMLEDTEISCQMEAVDIDPTDDHMIWRMEEGPSFLNIDRDSGLITGIPLNDDVGVHLINISVDDLMGGVDHIVFNITVTNVNDPPVAMMESITVQLDEDVPGDGIDLYPLFQDVDSEIFIFTVKTGDNISFHLSGEGILVLTSAVNWSGEETVMIIANDSLAQADITISVVVSQMNDPPFELEIEPIGLSLNEGGNHTFSADADDPDLSWGDELTYIWSSNVTGAIGTGKTLNLSLTPGYHLITLTVEDSDGGVTETSVEVFIEAKPVENEPGSGGLGGSGGSGGSSIIIIIIVIILILILLVIAGVVAFLIIRKKGSSDEGEEKTEETPPTGSPQAAAGTVPAADAFSRADELRKTAVDNGINIQIMEMQYSTSHRMKQQGMAGPAEIQMKNYNNCLEKVLRSQGKL